MPTTDLTTQLNLVINTLNAIPVHGKTDLSHMLGAIATLENVVKQLQEDDDHAENSAQ